MIFIKVAIFSLSNFFLWAVPLISGYYRRPLVFYKTGKKFLDLVSITPLMASSSDQCAVAEDSSLLDASKILFYNDPDDNNPLPNSISKFTSTSTNLHPFFHKGMAPSTFVVGSHHSGCVTQPSAHYAACITDPNNFEASMSCK